MKKHLVRHFLCTTDLSLLELKKILLDAQKSKQSRRFGKGALNGRVVALAFQKPSVRTRAAFEVAVAQMGGTVINLGAGEIQLGAREPVRDVARVLSRYVDAVVVRMFNHQEVEAFARYSSVPVINGLSDLLHPCQAMADLLTIKQEYGRLKGIRLTYVGDGNNVLHSLIKACVAFGVHLNVATPRRYRPSGTIWKEGEQLAKRSGTQLTWVEDPKKAVLAAQVIYTDVWVSMGQAAESAKRRKAFGRYQINAALLKAASKDARVMHCLPAHRGEEITDAIMEGKQSVVFDQAENRLHVQKALVKFLIQGA